MNEHPSPTSEPFPKFFWLVVALSPGVFIMLPHSERLSSAFLVLNGLLSFVGSYGLLKKPGQHVAITSLAAAFLAVFFWGFNTLVGVLGGCACGSSRFSP